MTDHEVTIVGAGFGGMGAAISLKRLGYGSDSRDLLILEREDDLGGTWHVNHYPGLAVDIASVTYSYSFEPNPYWQHWFARAPSSSSTPSTWPTPTTCAGTCASASPSRAPGGTRTSSTGWSRPLGGRGGRGTSPSRNHHLTSRFLVTATGFLSQPRLPDIEGVHDFAGEVIHTAKWDDTPT